MERIGRERLGMELQKRKGKEWKGRDRSGLKRQERNGSCELKQTTERKELWQRKSM